MAISSVINLMAFLSVGEAHHFNLVQMPASRKEHKLIPISS